MALEGTRILLWGQLTESHDALHETIFLNDGVVCKEYGAEVTHVICTPDAVDLDEPVIASATIDGARIVTEDWLRSSVVAKKLFPVDDFLIGKGVFDKCRFVVAGNAFENKDLLVKMIKNNGGELGDMVTKQTTHVVWGGPDGTKGTLAQVYKVPVVQEHWLRESIGAGMPLSENVFAADLTKTPVIKPKAKKPKPEKRKREADDSAFAPVGPVFSGLVFCVTGKFSMGTRQQVTQFLESHGASCKKTVTQQVTHLLASTGEEGTSKYAMAKGRGIPVVTEEWMMDAVAGGAPVGGGGMGPPPAKKSKGISGKVKVKAPPTTGGGVSASVASTHRLIKKGKCAVDPDSRLHENGHILEEGPNVYSVMLNQTNIANNNNKFYLVQLIADDDEDRYWVWCKWGRVGMRGQNSCKAFTDSTKAKKEFMSKFKAKTKNDWVNRADFVTYPKKYTIVGVDAFTAGVGADDEDSESVEDVQPAPDGMPAEEIESKLDIRVQDVVNLLCDVKKMEAMVIEMSYDISQMPLGKLKRSHIAKGSDVLRRIEAALKKHVKGKLYIDLSNDYYTLIPHTFGMRRPPVLNNWADLQKEIRLMEALGDIEVAKHTLSSKSAASLHPIDRNYQSLRCQLKPIDKGGDDWKIIQMYVKNTHAATHSKYTLEVLDAFDTIRPGEAERYAPNANDPNRMLLWHGSRASNFVGILSQGLRIAPPEAPVTGYMFGKGLYFADMSSKSANYCWATKDNDVACVLLAEVALGNQQPMKAAKMLTKPEAGYQSVFGVGSTTPNPDYRYTREDGVVVPLGKPTDAALDGESDLLYNEYVVYEVERCVMRYLVMLKFHWVDDA